jgi:hypothetical protein
VFDFLPAYLKRLYRQITADPTLFARRRWARWRARPAAEPAKWFIEERRAEEAKLLRDQAAVLKGIGQRRRTRAGFDEPHPIANYHGNVRDGGSRDGAAHEPGI